MNRKAILLILAWVSAAGAATAWPAALPALRLSDPLGTPFTHEQVTARGAVVVATAPTHAQGGAQQAWSTALGAVPRDPDGPAVVLLEDMSQSWFRPVVLARMKAAYRPGTGAVLLLDEGGTTRRALGVAENATVAFAFAPGGKLVAVEQGPGTPASAERLLRLARGP